MNPDHLADLLRTSRQSIPAARGPACPDDAAIAAYVDGTLPSENYAALEDHLADCAACLTLVSLVSADRDATPESSVPFSLLARAEAGAVPPQRPRVRSWASPVWAVAAMLVLVVPLLVYLDQAPGDAPAPQPAVRATRAAVPANTVALEVLAPSAGATVGTGRLDIRWTAVPGSKYYDVRIVTDEGDVLVEQRVSGTDWPVPASVALEPGHEYYVQVDAFPAGTEPMSSEHVPFSVAD